MIKITIFYNGKWSNSLLSSELETFKSSQEMGIRNKDATIEKFDKNNLNKNELETVFLKNLNKVYPNFKYRCVEESTIHGIIARLMGEIKPIHKIENSFFNEIKKSLTFKNTVFKRYNEMSIIKTKEKEIMTSSAGVLEKNLFILQKNDFTKRFYKLNSFLKSIIQNINHDDEVAIEKINNLISILNNKSSSLNDFDNFFEEYELENKEYSTLLIEIINNISSLYLTKKIEDIKCNNLKEKVFLNLINNNFYNAKIIYKIADFLFETKELKKYKYDVYNEKNSIKGMARENKATFTLRDIFKHFSNKKKTMNTSPYSFEINRLDFNKCLNQDVKFFTNFNVGIIKENGKIDIEINMNEEKEEYLYKLITYNAVGTIQIGKKGLGHFKIERV